MQMEMPLLSYKMVANLYYLKEIFTMIQKMKLNETKNIAGGFNCFTEICSLTLDPINVNWYVTQHCLNKGMLTCTVFERFDDMEDALSFVDVLSSYKEQNVFPCSYRTMMFFMNPGYLII